MTKQKVRVSCPDCKQHYLVKKEHVGKQFRCRCGSLVTITRRKTKVPRPKPMSEQPLTLEDMTRKLKERTNPHIEILKQMAMKCINWSIAVPKRIYLWEIERSRKRRARDNVKYEKLPTCKVCDKGKLMKRRAGGCIYNLVGIVFILFGLFSLTIFIGIPILFLGIVCLIYSPKKLICDSCGAMIDAK